MPFGKAFWRQIQARPTGADSGAAAFHSQTSLPSCHSPLLNLLLVRSHEALIMPGEIRSILRFRKLTENAFAPSKGSALAAGFDLCSAYDMVIPAYGKALVKTDIQVDLPEGCYGRIAPRSGLAWKHHIDVGAGVIDRDYRGNVGVVLFNHAKTEYEVKKGDRVAQLICERIIYPEIEEVEELMDTERGEGGFGSTGKQ